MLLWFAVTLGVAVLGIFTTVLLSWRRPEPGFVDGRLRPCPDSPNCVCSHATDDLHAVSPLTADGEDALQRIKQVMADWPRTKMIDESDGYLWYECTTPLLRYVDDVEFLVDEDSGVVHVRSASRVGHSDLGTNRHRIEEIRRSYQGGP